MDRYVHRTRSHASNEMRGGIKDSTLAKWVLGTPFILKIHEAVGMINMLNYDNLENNEISVTY